MNSKMLFTVLIAACVCVSGNVYGQLGVSISNNQVQLEGFGEVDLEKTVEAWSEYNRNLINQKMDLLIAQVNDVCKLSEKDTKKLQLSVKGIVSKRIAAGSEQVVAFAKKSGLVDDEEEQAEKEYAKHDQLKFYGASPQPEGIVQLSTYFEMPLIDHPLWSKALETSLSAEQLELYQQHRMSVNRKFLHAAIDLWIAQLDAQVFLTGKQVDDITNSLKKQLDEAVTTSFPMSLKQANSFVNNKFGLQFDSLGDLLNEKQTERRKSILNRPRGRVGWGNGPTR